MNIGKTIKYIRKRKAIKQCQLAELAGISVSALVGIEKGRFSRPWAPLMAFAKLSTFLKVACWCIHWKNQNCHREKVCSISTWLNHYKKNYGRIEQ